MCTGVAYIQCAGYAGLNTAELGTDAQQQRFLPDVAQGKLLFALALSESNVGADLASVETTAVRSGDALIVKGSKRWCSGAEYADFLYTLARSGPVEERYRNLSFLTIPRDAPGVSIVRTPAMGLRGTATADVRFDDVRISTAELMGGPESWNKGWSQLVGPTFEIEKL